ncbi:hormone receptor 4 [Anabrus simplex]|uniref:hormone receptor 4 n=1 Tax=Anabrus simplex TaxID=316456 RepID=UPI0035A3CF3F
MSSTCFSSFFRDVSSGIMTLTRTPCELDTMSLFQDLKLKRRKVDSRCSSDGESVADTSTSSPDMVGPVSPPPRTTEFVPSSPSPAQRDRCEGAMLACRASPDSALPEMARRDGVVKQEDHPAGIEARGAGPAFPEMARRDVIVKQEDLPVGAEARGAGPQLKEGGDNSVFDGGGGGNVLTVETPPPHRTVLSSPRHQQHPPSPVMHHPPSPVIPGSSAMNPPPTFWVTSTASPTCRINGVRPELIGGGSVTYQQQPTPPTVIHHEMKPPASHSQGPPRTSTVLSSIGAASAIPTQSSGLVRTTPTVIMGEAGGVRTMFWSHPSPMAVDVQFQQHKQLIAAAAAAAASTSPLCWTSSSSSTSSGNGVSSEESAAQLLLNLGQEQQQQHQQQHNSILSSSTKPTGRPSSLNMERLWAGDLTQLPASQQMQALNLTSNAPSAPPPLPWPHRNGGEQNKTLPQGMTMLSTEQVEEQEDDEQPMICMICEDKATGLHYGIITCEGCKGFFKRTVQNRRVYTCVADGNCEITKAQRNRCQYCRFKKCIEQGMVLQAVREDRMPGGRNSGAVYNLYKVKYKKHKKNQKNGQAKGQADKQKGMMAAEHGIPSHLVNGTILKTALTNPSEVVHLRQRLDNAVSSSRDRTFAIEATVSMIQTLIDCDEFQDIATLRNLDELLDHKSDLSEKLCQIGDSIVYKLVQWTKRLPFYLELPVEVHTRLLTHKWHELLVLTTSAYQAIHGTHKLGSTASDGTEADFMQEVLNNLCTLQTCLTSMMGRPITMDQLRQDVGLMVEKITHVTLMFRRIKLRMEEYVCLKVITMLNQARGGSTDLETIQERYMTCLRSFVEHNYPQQPTRFHDLLVRLPEVQSAAALLLESKMFYVPFLLNSAIQR